MATGVKTGGRQAGTPNKTTALLKDAILKAAEQAGGEEGLVGQVMRAPESRRIAILLEARGQKLKLDVDVDMLRAA